MAGYSIITLKDILQNEDLGESRAVPILSDFCCPKNPDVQQFLRQKAIPFEKQGYSRTHLVFASYRGKHVLVGYYSLAVKSLLVKSNNLKSDWKRKLRSFGKLNRLFDGYEIAAPLIGQLGKNFNNGYDKLISGNELLKLACDSISQAQSILGGRFVYLECEDTPTLVDFYCRNGFVAFDRRELDGDERLCQKGEYLVQLIRCL